jgi:RNA polymerase sigma factor (sigma-70 family)
VSHVADRQLTLVLQHLRKLLRREGAGGVADSELLSRFLRQRDEAAFEVLVWRHGPMVLAVAQRLLHHSHDAEDVLQATFLTLVRKAGSIGKRESLGSWLYKVAYRIALRVRARTARIAARTVPMMDVSTAASAHEEVAGRELRPLLDAAIGRLPEKYRLPIVLCHLQGKTQREVAAQLGCSLGTVSTRLIRARELLRRQLARQGVVPSAGLLAAVLGSGAAVSAPLVASTVQAASLFATGQAGVAGVVSANVAGLVEGVSQAMLLTKLKIATVFLVTVGVLAAGAGAMVPRERTAPPPDAQEAANRPARVEQQPATPPPAAGTVVVSGQVLDPDGQPVAGARLYWPRVPKEEPRSEEDIEIPQRATTGADGRFRFELPRSDLRPDWRLGVVATADGHGVAGARLPAGDESAEQTLRLVKDLAIQGRILTTEGKPLAGLRVSVVSLFPSAPEQLEAFLTDWKQEWERAHPRWAMDNLYLPADKGLLSTATDHEGRFRITGVGAGRVAVLKVSGPTIAQAMLYVVARADLDLTPFNQAAQTRIRPGGSPPPLLHGPSFDYVATPTRPIEGTVREVGSGKPVAGVLVWAGAGYNNGVHAVSDAQGRYRLVGLPKMKQYLLHTEPGATSPWLRAGARVEDTDGLQPLQVDFALARGVLLTGRVLDKATGKGVRSGVRFAPLPDNKYFKQPGYDSYHYERLTTPTDAEGRFRLAVIPGTGVLLAQVYGSGGRYRQATIDLADRPRVPMRGDGGNRYFTAADNLLESLTIQHACKVLDLAADAGTVPCDLFVDRGLSLTVHLQGPDGQPLPEAVVDGLTSSWPGTFLPKQAACTVHTLDPEIPQPIVFYHPERQLAGTLTVRGDEKEPPAVRLARTGTVIGRVLDAGGEAVAGAEVGLWFSERSFRELFERLNQKREPVRTDPDGRFRLGGLVPDLKFGLSIHQGRTLLVGEPRIGERMVGPGQTLDLGDVRTKPQQQ